MSKFGLVVVLLAQSLMLQAMDHESETQTPISAVEHHDHKNDAVENHVVSEATESPSKENGESKEAEAPQIRKLGKHHSVDKSVAGGGVIIGGLVTAIFAAVFCYIRVTRKRRNGY